MNYSGPRKQPGSVTTPTQDCGPPALPRFPLPHECLWCQRLCTVAAGGSPALFHKGESGAKLASRKAAPPPPLAQL